MGVELIPEGTLQALNVTVQLRALGREDEESNVVLLADFSLTSILARP